MGKLANSSIGAVLLLTLLGAACHRAENSTLAALDDALKAGVITRSEYDAKKAALAQLAALDKARDAGLLTAAEYQERQQRIAATVPLPAATASAAPVSSAPAATAAVSTAAISTAPASNPSAAIQQISSNASPPPTAALSTTTRQDHIFDAHLNLNAFNVTVPTTWKFDGIYVPGSSCAQYPFPVFRMYSPDGLSEVRLLPRLDWSWSDSRFKPARQADCLDLNKDMTAAEFLKYYMGMTQVAFVRDFPIPQAAVDAMQQGFDKTNEAMAASAKRFAQMVPLRGGNRPESKPAVQHGSIAGAIAEYRNGTFNIQERILVKITCMHAPINFGPETGKSTDSCNATIQIVRAPTGQLEALLALAESEHLGAAPNLEWFSKYLDYQNAVWKARSEQMNADFNNRMKSQHDEFERAQSMRAQQHQQFLSTMQEGTNRSMARAQQSADSRHAVAQDWADYALDRQTVTGPGGTVKISNAYSQTWTDGSGNYYQTNDPNTNPNGVLKGNWTQTTQVHGDGTAK
ncbi:MAG TPA: SHOCT domain-containing protein [Bryobacteraceae bacterium]|jgi:hypothetical protein|nr:SHOCT domain-containing protein [Bryobacteraceae bacterium]